MLCTECFQDTPAKTKLSFLGFPTFSCASCNKVVHHPLAMGRRIFYWILTALFGIAAIVAIANGAMPLPGLLALAVIVAVANDLSYSSKLKEAQRRHEAMKASLAAASAAQPPAPSPPPPSATA